MKKQNNIITTHKHPIHSKQNKPLFFDKTQYNLFNKYYKHIVKHEEHNYKHNIPFIKQWKNSVYNYDKNNLSLISTKQQIINRFIKNYFNLIPFTKDLKKSKRMRDYIKRSSLDNIYISNSEIKHFNDKVYITLYIFDRNKQHFIKKLFFSNKTLSNIFYTNKLKSLKDLNKGLFNKHIKSSLNYKLKNINMYNLHKNLNNQKKIQKKSFLYRYSINRSRFNIIRLNNIKINLIKNFNNKFLLKFWIWFSKIFNIHFTYFNKKIIIRWPSFYTTIESRFLKKDILNINNLNQYLQNPLVYYKLFNILCILPSENFNKLTLNIKNDKIIYLLKNNAGNSIFNSKMKLLNLIIIFLIKKIININLIKLYGKTFTNKVINIFWRRIFDKYYNNILKKRIEQQIFNLNKLLFNKDIIFNRRYKHMPVLKNILGNLFNKKILFNIVNIRYLHMNSDTFMEAVKKKLEKRTGTVLKVLRKSLKLIKIPSKFTSFNMIKLSEKWNNNLFDANKFTNIITNIKYKYITGARLEAKGRLTKRFTASRSVFKYKYKGNLKNLEFSRKSSRDWKRSPNLDLIRGSIKPNIQYTSISGTKRIGAFGLKGWLSNN